VMWPYVVRRIGIHVSEKLISFVFRVCPSSLEMNAAGSSETLKHIDQTIGCHIPEYYNLNFTFNLVMKFLTQMQLLYPLTVSERRSV
jgi:hypothetical protein